MATQRKSGPALAAAITRSASKQTYYTIRFLVDQDRANDAFRAYAYFRWLDDWLDRDGSPRAERLAFVERQQSLLSTCLRGLTPVDLTPEEWLLADLIQDNPAQNNGLHAYLHNMMAVMSFDTERRGRMISQRELNDYTGWLATAVTEALHYFVGHGCAAPLDKTRTIAVTGAHITHMLRDAYEDIEAGYYNMPRETAAAAGIAPWEVGSPAYRAWVEQRVQQARTCFQTGRAYFTHVQNLRCRIAGYAYTRRFEVVLDCIEREGYQLRAQYPERKRCGCALGMVGWAMWMALRTRGTVPASAIAPIR